MDDKREGRNNTDKMNNVKIDMKIASVYKLLGQIHLNRDRYDGAIQYFSKTIELGFNNAESYFYRGFIYFQKGEYNKSQNDIIRAKAFGYRVSEEFVDNLFLCLKRENNLDSFLGRISAIIQHCYLLCYLKIVRLIKLLYANHFC
jgi:tetratricopeptide (TPR) repeat protein